MKNHLLSTLASSFTFALALFLAVSFAPAPALAALSTAAVGQTLVKVDDGVRTEIAPDVSGAYVIAEPGAYELSGSGSSPVSIEGDVEVSLALSDAVVDATGQGASAIAVTGGAKATVSVSGACAVTGDVNKAGIEVAPTSDLVIVGTGGACSLSATGNAGHDYGSVADSDGTGAAGIGGTKDAPDAGAITIDGNGQNLTLSAAGCGIGAAGIGSAYAGGASVISIAGVRLAGVYGGCQDAAAEKDDGYAKQSLEGGPAIGGGTKGAAGGTVVIRDCAGVGIVGGSKSSGIGGGCWAVDAAVEIYDSELDVEGGMTGPAIGAGRVQAGSSAHVLIAGSTVDATGGYYAAGIGLGVNASNEHLGVSDIVISDSTVTASGGAGAAGIGAGVRGYNVNVSILDGSQVTAYAGANYMGSYTAKYNGSPDTVTADGGIGQAGAAAIGRGAWGSVTKFASWEEEERPKLSISADSEVTALSSGDNWAIAGFYDWEDVAATLMQVRFDRDYDLVGSDLLSQSVDASPTALYLDGSRANELVVKDADTNETVKVVETPDLGDGFAHGYAGGGHIGYYAFAMTVPAAGAYTVNTSSELRLPVSEGGESISSDDGRYNGGAAYYDGTDEIVRFTCAEGVNAFDRSDFRAQAASDPEPGEGEARGGSEDEGEGADGADGGSDEGDGGGGSVTPQADGDETDGDAADDEADDEADGDAADDEGDGEGGRNGSGDGRSGGKASGDRGGRGGSDDGSASGRSASGKPASGKSAPDRSASSSESSLPKTGDSLAWALLPAVSTVALAAVVLLVALRARARRTRE